MGLTVELARDLFEYRDGQLFWKADRGVNKLKGKLVGSNGSSGYLSVSVSYKKYLVHRIVFMLHHGYMPERIDHIDGDPHNNRIENLRVCTQTQNSYNRKTRVDNISGVKGVHWGRRAKKWVGQIQVGGVKKHIGYFATKDEAAAAVQIIRLKEHQEFARS